MVDQPPTQDLQSGTDFTQFNQWSGALMNSALASLQGNDAGDSLSGISFGIWTTDTAIGVPNVPNPTGPTTKWKNYFWIRQPFAGDAAAPQIYVWFQNEIGPPDPTYLNWISTAFDDSVILGTIAAVQTQVTTALNAANTANSNSTNALNIANSANTTAVNAANNVAAVQASANTALTTANASSNLATQANSTATSALATANAAAAAAALNKNITQINPGLQGQRIRTNDAGTSLEYYNTTNQIVILAEQIINNQGPSNFTTTRVLNTILQNAGNLCTNLSGNEFTLAKGVYKFRATIPTYGTASGSAKSVTSTLFNVTQNSLVTQGDTQFVASGQTAMVTNHICGFFTSNGTDQYVVQSSSTLNQAQVNITGTANYTIVELEKVG